MKKDGKDMIKEKILKIATAATCIATLIMPHTSVVLAAALTNKTPNETNTVRLISSEYHEGGEESSQSLPNELLDNYDMHSYKYTFGGANTGTHILKVLREDDKTPSGTFAFSDAFYCLNGNKSFPTINGAIEYNRTIADFFEENPSTLNLSQENYNSLCWLLDNLYLRKQMTSEQRAVLKDALIENAFQKILQVEAEDRPTIDEIKSILTDDDIEVIQQWAIWYFTNYGEKTLQDVPFTNEDKTLPTIDLTNIQLNTDSMPNIPGNPRYQYCTMLYQYLVNEALAHKTEEFTRGTATYPTIANKNATYTIEGDNYKVGPFKITAPSSNLSSSDYQITLTNETSELLSTAYTIKDANGNVINKKINEIFDQDYYIYLPTTNDVKNLKLNLSYTKFGTKASVWTAGDAKYQPLVLLTKEGDTVTDSVSVEINPIYDLALRKYIIAVNDTEITNRTPQVDISGLRDGSNTTAVYKHRKDPVEVKVGDTVTYRITVYNEGNVEAKVSEIVDYLPAGLELATDNEINNNFGWTISENGTVITTKVTEGTSIPAFGNSLQGTYVDVVCKVTDKATSGAILTNIAEIKADNINDRDSSPDSLANRISSIDKSTYTGSENKEDLSDSNYFYKGSEDDDDFEKLIVAGKAFDLSLQKFITKVNGKTVTPSREPKVNTNPLKNGSTNAEYTTVKTPVFVQKGDIVTYTIRVYNEGEEDGYAESIADYLPDGLGYLVNYNENINNYWAIPTDSQVNTVKLNQVVNGTKNLKVTDFTGVTDLNNVDVVKGAVKLTSTALNSSKSDNLIKAFDGSDKLSYKEVQITCIVLEDSNLRNIAEITNDSDANKNEVTDRDSTPDTVDPNNYPGNDQNQDDHDYEILVMKKFDLALQKFITAVNDKEIKDRVPKVSLDENKKIKYEHPETALEVNHGDIVTYTIRVYNEGEVDGYAAEINDDIPNGLEFDSNNEINKKYGWVMVDANGNVTKDVSKATEIRTDYLSKQKAEARKESALLTAFDSEKGNLFFLDVKVAFKVNSKASNNTIINTAEITKDTDSEGNEIDDIDSTPNNKKEGEDDIDQERIHVGYFDLALQKDLKKAIVTEGSSTKEIIAQNGELKKVEINRKKINSTIVKFVYTITIKNEGTIPGYAKEIKDYIPEGLQFVEADDKNWKAGSDGTITTEALANTLLKPGESASVEVTLRWINNENNMGTKINVAEISKDYNEAGDVDDIDSTPDNKKEGEDDIDDAPVILTIATGRAPVYVILTTAVLVIIGTGVVAIKKYVL